MTRSSLSDQKPYFTQYNGTVQLPGSASYATPLYGAQLVSAAAFVDASQQLLYFQRMPKAKYAGIAIAVNKAFTAAGFGIPTHV
jgi:hypothetical protein